MFLLFITLSTVITYPFSLLFTLCPSIMLIYFFILTLGTLAIKSWWALLFAITGALWFLALRSYSNYVNVDYFYNKCLKDPIIYSRIQLKQVDLKPRKEFIEERIEKNAKKPLMFKIRAAVLTSAFLVPILFLALWNLQIGKVENDFNYSKQIVEISKEIENSPDDFLGYAKRAYAYQNENGVEEAIEDYDKAIELKDNDYRLYLERARIYRRLKDYENVIEDTTKALGLIESGGESDFDKYINEKTDITEAREKSKTAALRLRGRAHMKEQEYEKAVSDFDVLIYGEKGDVECFFRGIAKYHLKDKDGALKDFDRHKCYIEERLKAAEQEGARREKLEKALKKTGEWIEKTKELKPYDAD